MQTILKKPIYKKLSNTIKGVMKLIIVLRFFLELVILLAIAYGGFHLGNSYLTKILFGIGALVITMIIWGLYGSPNAPFALQGVSRLLLELGILTVAIAFVWNLFSSTVIIVFAIIFVLNSFYILLLDANRVNR